MDEAGADHPRLHLRIVDDAGAVTSLGEWMSFVTAELTRQGTAIRQLGTQSADMSRELSALTLSLAESRLAARGFRSACADLRQRLDDLDRRLNNMLALFEENFGGGQTEQGMRHHDYAAEYAILVEQKIIGLALDILPGRTQATAREKAEFVAAVCFDLFGVPEVPEQQLVARLPESAPAQAIQRMRDICAEARALRAKAAQGRPQRWEFGCEVDVPVDEEWQELWTGADHGGVVDFVVAPAYVVDSDTLLRKQKVFTSLPPGGDPAQG